MWRPVALGLGLLALIALGVAVYIGYRVLWSPMWWH